MIPISIYLVIGLMISIIIAKLSNDSNMTKWPTYLLFSILWPFVLLVFFANVFDGAGGYDGLDG